YGRQDSSYPASGEPQQRSEYSGSHDVTSAFIESGGHAFALERTAPLFRQMMGDWLSKHGWVTAVATAVGPNPAPPPGAGPRLSAPRLPAAARQSPAGVQRRRAWSSRRPRRRHG